MHIATRAASALAVTFLLMYGVQAGANTTGYPLYPITLKTQDLSPPPNYAAGNPSSVVAADLNNDKHADVIETNESDANVEVFLQNADGSYQPGITYPTGTKPVQILAADLNLDRYLDLAVLNSDGTVSVYLGDGTGAFPISQTVSVSNNAARIAFADMDGDGKPDLLVANGNDDTISVMIGNGDGTFQSASTYATAAPVTDIATLKLDKGRYPDVVAAEGRTIETFLNNGDGTLASPTQISVSYAQVVTTADMNGDHKPDVVTAGTNTVSVLLNTGKGGLGTPITRAVPGGEPGYDSIQSIATGDFNGDHHADVAVPMPGYPSTLTVLSGDGTGALHSPIVYNLSNWSQAVAAADMNGDHKPDLVVATRDVDIVSILLNDGSGTFDTNSFYDFSLGAPVFASAVADVDGDGTPDIVTTANAPLTTTSRAPSIAVFPGNGNGTFKTPAKLSTATNGTAGGYLHDLVLGDFNGDGKFDAVTLDSIDSLCVAPGNGDGTFVTTAGSAWCTTLTGARYVATGHLMAGDPGDLAVSDNAGVEILLGNGDGTFTDTGAIAVGSAPTTVAIADVNGDGNADLVVLNTGDGTVGVLLGNGDGTFQPMTAYPVGTTTGNPQPYGAAVLVTRFGSAAYPAIVVANYGDSTVGVLTNTADGSGNFNPMVTYAVNGHPLALAIGTAGLDNNKDLFVTLANTTVQLLLGNGDGTFNEPGSDFVIGNLAQKAEPIVVAPLTGDGWPDIVTADYGLNVLLHLNPLPVVQDPDVATPGGQQATGTFSAYNPYGFNLAYATTSSAPAAIAGATTRGVELPGSTRTGTTGGGGTFTVDASGNYSYTPAVGFTGTDDVYVSVKNAHGQATTTIPIYVGSGPVPTDITVFDLAGSSTSGHFHAQTNSPHALTYAIVQQPAHGTARIAPYDSSRFLYTPASGFTGADSFTFTAADGAEVSAATATVTVNVVKSAPTPPGVSGLVGVTVTSGNTTKETFTLSGSGALFVTASSSDTTLLPNGNINGESTCMAAGSCTLSLKPAAGQTGSATVAVTATDPYGRSASGSFTVTVSAAAGGGGGGGGSSSGSGGGGGGAFAWTGLVGLALLAILCFALSRKRAPLLSMHGRQ